MRKVVHRILSALPMFAIALLALFATADPARAKRSFVSASALVSDARFFWLCVGLLVAYAALWWITSVESKSRRAAIQAGLRPHFEGINQMQAAILRAQTEEEYLAAVPILEERLQRTVRWLSENMSAAAVEKFLYPVDASSASFWTWPNHTGASATKRSNMLTLNKARLEVLDTFLRYDGWDGEEPSLRQRALTRINKWKSRKSASAPS